MVAQVSILGRLIDFLSSQPSTEEIIAIKATEEEEKRVDYLSRRKNSGEITPAEKEELYNSLLAEYIMGIAKANAYGRLNAAAN